jgi:hypothetical protein
MNWSFPEIKTTRGIELRIQKVKDELEEFELAENPEEKDEEAIDVLHSVETLLRKQFEGREEILDGIVARVFHKNSARGYYARECF